jgi:predicted glycosyltransferase involved in capsule biosynthesis
VSYCRQTNPTTTDVAWDYSWDDEADDSLFYDLAESARVELDEYTQATGLYNEYIYLNYAGGTENPLRGYGADDLAFLQQVQKDYDPDRIFQRLMPGGFKVWRA